MDGKHKDLRSSHVAHLLCGANIAIETGSLANLRALAVNEITLFLGFSHGNNTGVNTTAEASVGLVIRLLVHVCHAGRQWRLARKKQRDDEVDGSHALV